MTLSMFFLCLLTMLIISSYLQLQCGDLCGDLPAPPELHGNLLYQNGQVNENQLLLFYLENLKSSISIILSENGNKLGT